MEEVLNFLRVNSWIIAAVAVILSAAALYFSIYSFKKTRTATLYSDIDGRYFELLKLGIANPAFVNPDLTKQYKTHFQRDDLLKYDRYAFAAWNIVETIIDRDSDKMLARTWNPVIKEENMLHRAWLNDPENQHKFKKQFWEVIIGNKEFPCPDCEKLNDGLCPRCKALDQLVKSLRDDEMLPLSPQPDRLNA